MQYLFNHDKGHRRILNTFDRVPIIPVSAIQGDNLVELSPKCSWYDGWAKEGHGESKTGTTLLEALDISFRVQ